MAEKIHSKVASGIKWNALSVIGTRGTDFMVKLVLARLLLPEAFGVVGMALIITGFLSIFSDMGLFNALVQKKEDEKTQIRYSSAFWYLLFLAGLFVVLFFLFISPLGARFYNEPRLVPVLNALSFYLFFNILSIVPRVILTKQLNFKNLVRITYAGTAISSVVAITMAFLNFGVWSLVAKSVVGSGIIFFSYWLKVGWRPSFVFQPSTLKELAGYSFFTQTNAILFYIRNNLDYIIIGKLASTYLLGVYTLAFTLSETLRSQLYSIFNKVFFPVYSKLQDDKKKIKEYYLKVMRLTAVVTFPVSVMLIAMPEEILLVAFGAKWIEAAAPLRILAIASMIFAISGTPAEVLKSIGKVSVSFYLNITNTFLVALPLMYLGLQYFGLQGVAYAVCVHYTVSRLTFHHFMKKYIGLTNKEVFVTLRKPVLTAAVMLGMIELVSIISLNPYIDLLKGLLTGGLVYTILLHKDLAKIYSQLTNKRLKGIEDVSGRLWKQKPLIYQGRKSTYKFFPINNQSSKSAEANGNQKAMQSSFWKEHILEVKPGRFYLRMQTGKPVLKEDYNQLHLFIESKLDQTSLFPFKPGNEVLDVSVLKKINCLSIAQMNLAEEMMQHLQLPVTSAHGDLHIHNIINLHDEFKIIDWSMFSESGSFVTDYIHFHNYNLCSKKRESWTNTITTEHDWLLSLALRYETTTHQLRLAYAISRISGELAQTKSTDEAYKKTGKKYLTILKNLLDEFSKSKIQHHNTLV